MKPTNSKSELSKIPGFDIMERLPEEQMLKSYNEEFYNSISTFKFNSLPILPDEQLFYHFEQNDNASVSTTTGQLLSTYEELVKSNIAVKKMLKSLAADVKALRKEMDVVDDKIYQEYRPPITKMTKEMQNFLVDQKTENFKLIKEIAILDKEKADLQNSVYCALGKLHKLEREVGVKSKAFTYLFDQSIVENEISNKFVIEKEDI